MIPPPQTFKIEIGVKLQLEVEAQDEASALRLVDGAFARADPLMSATVRTPRLHPLVLGIARVFDALPTARAKIAEGAHRGRKKDADRADS